MTNQVQILAPQHGLADLPPAELVDNRLKTAPAPRKTGWRTAVKVKNAGYGNWRNWDFEDYK